MQKHIISHGKSVCLWFTHHLLHLLCVVFLCTADHKSISIVSFPICKKKPLVKNEEMLINVSNILYLH